MNSLAEKILVLGKLHILGLKMLITVDLLKSFLFLKKKKILHNEKGQPRGFLVFFIYLQSSFYYEKKFSDFKDKYVS